MKLEPGISIVRVFGLLMPMLLCASGLLLSCRGGRHVAADCGWDGEALAWLDKNGNGIRDKDEPPLPGVRFLIDDTLNHYTDVGKEAVSDRAGVAALSAWLPGCPEVEFEIYAQPPDGYVATTQARVAATDGKSFAFGFAKEN